MQKLKKFVGTSKFDLTAIIPEKKNYVVTMSIAKNDSFHMLLASVAALEEITTEIMQENIFFYIIDGEGFFEIENKKLHLKKNDSLFMPAKTSYAIKGLNNFKFLEIGFLKGGNDMSINLLEKSKVMKLKEMIEIEEGKVLSKNLVNNANLVLTLMSLGKDEVLATHTTPGDALVIMLEGTGIFTIDDKDYEVNENESILMPANIKHAVKAKTSFKMLLNIVFNK